MSAHLTILRSYAKKRDPTTIPPSVLFSHTDTSLTIFDLYPKAMFHFLTMPRLGSAAASATNTGDNTTQLTVFDLANLRSLLKHDKTRALEVLKGLEADARDVKAKIEEEMVSRYGFKWDIWTGFHAVPSLEHLHLHIISSDLCSPALKNKKHYLSFNPKQGFFLHLSDVLEWFDAEPDFYKTMSELKPSKYEPLLKESLSCWRCGSEMKNIPILKEHLQKEWDEEAERENKRLERKRKREQPEASESQSEAHASKHARNDDS